MHCITDLSKVLHAFLAAFWGARCVYAYERHYLSATISSSSVAAAVSAPSSSSPSSSPSPSSSTPQPAAPPGPTHLNLYFSYQFVSPSFPRYLQFHCCHRLPGHRARQLVEAGKDIQAIPNLYAEGVCDRS